MTQITVDELSNLTGHTTRTCRKRIKEAGLEPIGRRGNGILFESRDALKAIYGYTAPTSDAVAAKAQLDRVRREEIELRLELQRGNLLRADEVEALWVNIATTTRTRQQELPSRLAPVLAGKDAGEVEHALTTALTDALATLGDGACVTMADAAD